MHCKVVFLSLLIALSCVSAVYINSIYVDQLNGQIYVADATELYEIDNVALTQNGFHNLSKTIDDDSLYIKKIGNKRYLYALLDGTDGSLNLETYTTPIPNGDLRAVNSKVISDRALSLDPTYDSVDSVGVFSPSRNLTLVNLDTLTRLDSFTYWTGSRIFGRNVVYNHNNNHVIIFKTRVPYTGAYGLTVDEYDTTGNKFTAVPTTYQCNCNNPDTLNQSSFYKAIFEDCDISYTTTNGNIWCGDGGNSRLFNFQANDLSKYQVISLKDKKFDDVAWDFANKFAYIVRVAESYTTFNVSKVNLVTGKVVASQTHTVDSRYEVDSYLMKVDADQPNLYIAAATRDDSPPAILVVNTNTLAVRVVTLSRTV